ncbi:CHASE2 domain-containing protein [Candidatus Latescibacterota bacterium]
MKSSSPARKIFFQDLLLSVLILLLLAVLSNTGTLDFFNWKLYDVLVTIYRSTPEQRDNVVFACIDQKSIDYFDRISNISWPWPREFYAQLLRYLAGCGAKAVVFDIIFSEPGIDREETSGDEMDDDFSDAIEETGIAYLAVSGLDGSITQTSIDDSEFILEETDKFSRFNNLERYKSALYPIPKFIQGARGLGLVNLEPENDGIYRRYPLFSKVGDKYFPSIGLTVVKNLLDEDTYRSRILDIMERETVVDDEGKVFLNWYGEGGVPEEGSQYDTFVFDYYSFHAIIASSLQEEMGDTPVIPRETFRDKIVIVGSNAPGLFDLKATPFTFKNLYPGMEIHATAIENLLTGDLIPRVPYWIVLLSMVAIAFILFGIDKYFKNLRLFIIVYFLFIIVELGAAYILILAYQWIAAVDIIGTTTCVFAALVISGYFRETREKRVLTNSFGRYVNDSVLKDILKNPSAVDFNGRTITATIMATDIAGFTSISEKLPPHEVVSQLNDYLSEVSETLIDNGAFINKYIGDAILALYGAFDEPDHQKKACLAALSAQKIINRKIEEAQKDNRTPFITRIGITTGEMTLGNIGSERKIEYTVIGDSVNSAFRLEGLNKFYNTRVLVSEYTKEHTDDDFEFRLLDTLRVKGKEKPESVYELLGIKGEIEQEKFRMRDEFEKALKLYRSGQFKQALELFEHLSDNGDEVSSVFIRRCQNFIEEPPPSDWNGIWVMQRK